MKTNVDFDQLGREACQLDELPPGRDAVVEGLEGGGATDRRLMDLGLLPLTEVRMIRRAPLGDPTIYALRGYRLCLRKSDAHRIRVRLLEEPSAE